ncbi:R3H and coiled-coil domain-containing protein 1 [Iris pallida]|uniref:R3H and coiled-coil domain-containing protein 1 n=1 Tax=Iris pallida TaxID=29817 RepID=A0AAX6FXC5_IRIPA|nr:R3H and coiled-coil domain-containing protein 1 [Iris pallida]
MFFFSHALTLPHCIEKNNMDSSKETINGSDFQTLNSTSSSSRSRDLDAPEAKTRVSNSSKVHVEEEEEEKDEDWEALAECAIPGEALLTPQQQETASKTSTVDPLPQGTPKRRGRGSFLYQKSCLYSDQPDAGTTSVNTSESEDVEGQKNCLENVTTQVRDLRFGTGHVLVLYDFSPSTRTIDLEKLFDDFRDRGFAIRWVNDTTALAVFRTPSIAHEALIGTSCPFKVRSLEEEDDLVTQISPRDLEPPVPRPKTSTRTAQRLIAQGMGIKLSTNFGSSELRKQEEARKNRILSRQSLKDDAWGSDDP